MKKLVVIKMGGQAVSNSERLEECLKEIGCLTSSYKFVMVHGGGHEISSYSEKLGIQPRFVQGIRMTSPAEMTLVDMVLAGSFNKLLVRSAHQQGLKAVGVSGSDGPLFLGESIGPDNHTGRILETDPALVKHLLSGGYFPVVAPPSLDYEGMALNINADEAALGLASALKASALIFLSDIPGIMEEGKVIPKMSQRSIKQAIKSQVITGGMIPKVQSSLSGLEGGIRSVVIGQYQQDGSLLDLINGDQGTEIHLEP